MAFIPNNGLYQIWANLWSPLFSPNTFRYNAIKRSRTASIFHANLFILTQPNYAVPTLILLSATLGYRQQSVPLLPSTCLEEAVTVFGNILSM